MNNSSIKSCFISEWKLKFFLGMVLTGAFWTGYFILGNASVLSGKTMPLSAVDRMIPFVPEMSIIYVSQFISAPLIVWLMRSREDILSYCGSVILLSAFTFMIFSAWPTMVHRPDYSGGNIIYSWIVRIDSARNACPSLHAGFGILTAACANNTFRDYRYGKILIAIAWIWTLAVMLSALLIKQHVLVDIIAGSALGGISYWLCFSSVFRKNEGS